MFILFIVLVFIVNTSYTSCLRSTSSKMHNRVIVNLDQIAQHQREFDDFIRFIQERNEWFNNTIKDHQITSFEFFKIMFPGFYSKFLTQIDTEHERHQQYQSDGILIEDHPRDCYDTWEVLFMFTQDQLKIPSINNWIETTHRKK